MTSRSQVWNSATRPLLKGDTVRISEHGLRVKKNQQQLPDSERILICLIVLRFDTIPACNRDRQTFYDSIVSAMYSSV